MQEEFYSLLKLVSGEEVVAKVCPSYEGDKTILILDKPVTIKDIVMSKNGVRAYKVEPWVKLVEDDMFFVDMNRVITMTEIFDPEIIRMYKRYIKDTSGEESTSRIKPSKSMGYISTVDEFKSILEKLYKSS